MTKATTESSIQSLDLLYQGKVRDIYDFDPQHYLIVTSDRLSAFDVVFAELIPEKGRILNQISNFWFDRLASLAPNHTTDIDPHSLTHIEELANSSALADRCAVVKKAKPLPVEAIVRNYLIGSGWKEYQQSGSVCGIALPDGLELAAPLPEPLFTPSTKAAKGDHDINISFEETIDLIGEEHACCVRDMSLVLCRAAAEYAMSRGIIIADTKLEFGIDENGSVILIDEIFTPDSSRLWAQETYQPGQSPESFDKQFVRDYLEQIEWNKEPPPPALPADIIAKTADKYKTLQTILMPSHSSGA